MRWTLLWSKNVLRQLRKIDPYIREMIVRWMHANIDGCENPRMHGKALVGNHAGEWRYRVGNYRIICSIEDYELVVLALEVGHRKDIY